MTKLNQEFIRLLASMKYPKKILSIILFILLFLVTSCLNSEQKQKQQAIKIAEEYVTSHMKESVREEINGVITIMEENRKFVIRSFIGFYRSYR